jgi:hypothetical protein
VADVKTSATHGGTAQQSPATYVQPVKAVVSPYAGSKDVTGGGSIPYAKPGK